MIFAPNEYDKNNNVVKQAQAWWPHVSMKKNKFMSDIRLSE